MATRPKAAASSPAPDEPAAPLALAVSPHGVLHLDPLAPDATPVAARVASRITSAFAEGSAAGLLHLGSVELGTSLPPSLAFGRDLAKLFFSRLCALPDLEAERAHPAVTP